MRVPKAADVVAEHIRERIVRGELREGDLLPRESTLMADLGVSRPTLREAYRVLESEALITVRRGSGGGARVRLPTEEVTVRHAAMVLELRGTSSRDLYTARAMIESPVAALVARSAKSRDVRRLRKVLAEEEKLEGDTIAEIRAINEFHRVLTEMTGNQTLTFVTSVVQGLVTKDAENGALAAGGPPYDLSHLVHLHQEHEQLVDLIEAHDVEAADALWREHLFATLPIIERRINGGGSSVRSSLR
jgi:DNA-binding FadR family transcriptional regulator